MCVLFFLSVGLDSVEYVTAGGKASSDQHCPTKLKIAGGEADEEADSCTCHGCERCNHPPLVEVHCCFR